MVSILNLPSDVLRLIIEEIPDPKGFLSIGRSCNLLRRLCNEKRMNDRAIMKYRRKCVAHGSCHEGCTYYVLPNGTILGYKYYYEGREDRTQLLSRCKYINGVREGLCEHWNSNGIKIAKGLFWNGVKHGLWSHWGRYGDPSSGVLWGRGCFIRDIPVDD